MSFANTLTSQLEIVLAIMQDNFLYSDIELKNWLVQSSDISTGLIVAIILAMVLTFFSASKVFKTFKLINGEEEKFEQYKSNVFTFSISFFLFLFSLSFALSEKEKEYDFAYRKNLSEMKRKQVQDTPFLNELDKSKDIPKLIRFEQNVIEQKINEHFTALHEKEKPLIMLAWVGNRNLKRIKKGKK